MRKKKKEPSLVNLLIARVILGKGGIKKFKSAYKWSAMNAEAEHNDKRERTAKRCYFTGEKIYTLGEFKDNGLGGVPGPSEKHRDNFINDYFS